MTSDTKMKNAEENQRLKYLRLVTNSHHFANNFANVKQNIHYGFANVKQNIHYGNSSLVTLTGQNAVLGLSMRYARTR